MRVPSLCKLLLLLLVGSATAVSLKQATRKDILKNVKKSNFVDLRPRQSEPSCPDSDTVPTTKRRLFTPEHPLFTHSSLFPGAILSPSEVASYLLNDGAWLASNGSYAIDYGYLEEVTQFREKRWGVGEWALVKRFGRAVSKLTVNALAAGIIRGFLDDPEKIFILSDNHGMKATDIVQLVRELLAIPDWEDVTYIHHVVHRSVVEVLEKVLCPGMGPEFCGVVEQ